MILGDGPLLGGIFGVNCAFDPGRCEVSKADAAPGRALAAAAFAGVPYFDPFPLLCYGEVCGARGRAKLTELGRTEV